MACWLRAARYPRTFADRCCDVGQLRIGDVSTAALELALECLLHVRHRPSGMTPKYRVEHFLKLTVHLASNLFPEIGVHLES
jgi:hypothetical protein